MIHAKPFELKLIIKNWDTTVNYLLRPFVLFVLDVSFSNPATNWNEKTRTPGQIQPETTACYTARVISFLA